MRKIAYIELDTHAEIASNFMQLAKQSSKFQTDYFFSEKILKQLEISTSDNVFVSSPKTILNQLEWKNYDFIIVGTVHRFFNVFEQIISKNKSAIIVHNINFSKANKSTLFFNIFKNDFAYRLKLLLKESLFSVSEIHKKANVKFVLDQNLVSSGFRFLPLFFTEKFESEKQSNTEILNVVIPGTVSQKRRDYNRVLEILKTLKSSISITFLGKAEADELQKIENVVSKNSENISIKHFTEKVPKSVFNKIMQEADVVWCPIHQETDFFSVKEFYGKTKMSGNIGDAIHFGKPALMPHFYSEKYDFAIDESNVVDILEGKNEIKNSDFSLYGFSKILADFEKVLEEIS